MRNKFFIHIPKNAGSSVRKTGVLGVRPWTLKSDYFQNLQKAMSAEGLTHHAGHARWRDLQGEFQEMDCFAIVRNPYSRVVSRYTFLCRIMEGRGESPPPFKDWMETRHVYRNKPFWWHRTTMNWYPQVDHITNEEGAIKCRIFRLENLPELESYLGESLPKKNESNPGRPWEEFYTNESKRIIRDWYSEDFERLDYEK